MSQTVTVVIEKSAADSEDNGQHHLTFLSSFFEKNPDWTPEKVQEKDLFFLLDTLKLGTFFHSERGPAWKIVSKKTGNVVHEEFWLNGNRVTDAEQVKKMKHDLDFSEQVNDIINN
jgi:hypothetical protein